MKITQQIFLFFYAVLYGAFFTLSDRWKPFTFEVGGPGARRYWLSIGFLLGLPAIYFSHVFLVLGRTPLSGEEIGFTQLLTLAILVTPIYGFYCLWAAIIQSKRRCFYADSTWNFLVEKGSQEFLDESRDWRCLLVGIISAVVPLILLYVVF